jgi:replicative DNA helicase
MEKDFSSMLRQNRKGSGMNLWFENYQKETGKIPPQSVDIEEAVLGALMIEKDALTTVVDILQANSFYREANQRIYKSIINLFAKSEPIDLLTVTQQLRKEGELEFVGGAQYLAKLTSRVNSAANIEYHARIISQNSIKRDLIQAASVILRDAFEDTQDVFDLLDKTEQSFYEISERNIRKNYQDAASIMKATIDELEKKKDNKDGLTGIASGFTALDRITGGWQKTELTIIAARPAMGKTAFVLNAMRNAAVDFNQPVAIFSLEMSSTQLMLRFISSEVEISSEKLRKGTLEEHEWQQLHHRIDRLSSAPIFIDDTPALSIMELRAKCRRLKAQHDIQMIGIDYLQLMTGDANTKGNREQEIASISRALKNLAKELDVPVIALSQLSRAVETRGGDKRPMLSDLRESGSIEQDADMVMFLYRPDYYKITVDDDGNSTKDTAELIIAKNRSGMTDTVRLKFIGQFTRFTDIDGFYNPLAGFKKYDAVQAESGGDDPFQSFEKSGSSSGEVVLGSKANIRSDKDSSPDSENEDDEEYMF